MRFVHVGMLALLLSGRVEASENQLGTLKQILAVRHRAVAVLSTKNDLKSGSELVVTFQSGKQCALRVVDVKDDLATLDTSSCPQESDLVVGQTVERSLFAAESESPIATKPAKSEQLPPAEIASHQRLSDIGYFVPAGKILIDGSFSVGKQPMDLSQTSGGQSQKLSDSTINSKEVTLQVMYGFFDKIFVEADLPYLADQGTDTTYGPASSSNGKWQTAVSRGVEDPGLGVGFRVLDSKPNDAKVDLVLRYSPKLVDSKIATLGHDGTGGRGGDQLTAAVQFSQKYREIEYGLSAIYTNLGDVTQTYADNSDILKTSGGNQATATANLQAALGEILVLRTGLSYSSVSSTQTQYQISGSSMSIDPFSLMKFQAGLIGDFGKYGVGLTYSYVPQATFSGHIGSYSGTGHVSGTQYLLTVGAEL